MSAIVYSLCALTSLACFVFLQRAWLATRVRLLFWSGLCFAVMTATNFLLVIDKLLFPAVDLGTWRLLAALVAVLLLLFGLVWDEE